MKQINSGCVSNAMIVQVLPMAAENVGKRALFLPLRAFLICLFHCLLMLQWHQI